MDQIKLNKFKAQVIKMLNALEKFEPTPEELKMIISFASSQSDENIDEEMQEVAFIELEKQSKLPHTLGVGVYNKYENDEWYTKLTQDPSFKQGFWERYKSELADSNISPKSINILEYETIPDILNRIGNPRAEFDGQLLTRGMIMGDVQSGKTSSFLGLITKAADTGYKVVIVLAGTTETLRVQTQQRLDSGIIGNTQEKKNLSPKKVGVGLKFNKIPTFAFTSAVSDFAGVTPQTVRLVIDALENTEAILVLVIKKNVPVLNNLYEWLKDNNLNDVDEFGYKKQEYINWPLLLLDDEADNASINTRKGDNDPTRTNSLIRKICGLFKNSTYVGITATPFANVFIDPDAKNQDAGADLFPRDFFYSLPIPANYVSAQRIFKENGDCHHSIRPIDDIIEPDYLSDEYYEQVANNIDELNKGKFYYQHKKEWHGELPYSLTEAIYSFFLANAVRDLRHDELTHRSMLVNMSRLTNVQKYIAEEVEDIYHKFYNTIQFDFSDNKAENKRLPLYKELERIWEKHYSNVQGVTFADIVEKNLLKNAIKDIKVVVVNSSKSSSKLVYPKNGSTRVIAVGGLALSRGLTLEGLITSYFYRNTATFDVLMQMGRWFGYRPNYEDLCKIWISHQSANWYEEIADATEELKESIHKMNEEQKTPEDFGLRVQYKSEELRITAPNKMRNAFNYLEKYTYYGELFETPYINTNIKWNTENIDNVEILVNTLNEKKFILQRVSEKSKAGTSFYKNIPREFIEDFIGKIHVSHDNLHFNITNVLDFITKTNYNNWDILFMGGAAQGKYPVAGLEDINLISRPIFGYNKNAIYISSARSVLGTNEASLTLSTEEIAFVKKEWEKRQKALGQNKAISNNAYFQLLPNRNPLLIITMVEPQQKDDGEVVKNFKRGLNGDPIVSFAIGIPASQTNMKSKTYKVNKRYIEQYKEQLKQAEEEVSTSEE